MPRPVIALLMTPSMQQGLLGEQVLAELAALGEVKRFGEERKITAADAASLLADADICLNTWGTPSFDQALLDRAPKLKLIVYCAGSIKGFVSDAMWSRGVRVTSGAYAIAYRVAEYVLGMSIMGLRQAWLHNQAMHHEPTIGHHELKRRWPDRELCGSTVGVVSLGQVGRQVVKVLREQGPVLLGFDPFMSEKAMADLGVRKVDLDTLLRMSDVVTLHAPSLPETRHMIGAAQLRLMKDGALLINSSRGAVIDEQALINELRSGRINAILDVTDPEPPAADSPLRQLPNVFLTPHIAGGQTRHLGRQALDEVSRYLKGEPQVFEVTKERLATLA